MIMENIKDQPVSFTSEPLFWIVVLTPCVVAGIVMEMIRRKLDLIYSLPPVDAQGMGAEHYTLPLSIAAMSLPIGAIYASHFRSKQNYMLLRTQVFSTQRQEHQRINDMFYQHANYFKDALQHILDFSELNFVKSESLLMIHKRLVVKDSECLFPIDLDKQSELFGHMARAMSLGEYLLGELKKGPEAIRKENIVKDISRAVDNISLMSESCGTSHVRGDHTVEDIIRGSFEAQYLCMAVTNIFTEQQLYTDSYYSKADEIIRLLDNVFGQDFKGTAYKDLLAEFGESPEQDEASMRDPRYKTLTYAYGISEVKK